MLKHTPDSFFETVLLKEPGRMQAGTLEVAGMMTHMCVDTTVRAARPFGYPAQLVGDACATKELRWNQERIPAPTVQAVFLAALKDSFAQVVSTEEWLFQAA